MCANWGTSYPDSVPMFFPNNATNLAYAYWNTNISYGSDYATSFLTHAHDISKDVKNLCNCCSNYNVSSYLSDQVQQCRGATFIFYQYDNLIDVNFFLSADGWNYSDLNNDIYPITQMVSFVGENSPANNCYTNHLRGIVNLNSLTKSYNVYATDNYYSSVYRQVKYCNSLIEGIHSNDKYHVYLSSKENMNISVDNFD